jgi:two-component system response regulator AtoC
VPPLRDRREEIPALAEFFIRKFAGQYGRPLIKPSPVLYDALMSYAWPGNVRELENAMKRYVILRDETMLLAEIQRDRRVDPPVPPPAAPASAPAPVSAPAESNEFPNGGHDAHGTNGSKAGRLPDLARAAAIIAEREAIQQALDRFHWNRRKASRLLGVSYKTLLNKMKECGISAPVEVDEPD